MRFHDFVSSMGALNFHIFVVAVMSMVFDFAFLLLVVTISVRPPYGFIDAEFTSSLRSPDAHSVSASFRLGG
jgi:hypothetical protein